MATVTGIVLDVRRGLRECYCDPMIEPSSPHYRFAGLCDVASEMVIDRLKSVDGYGPSFTAETVHGEQRHSTRIRSTLWGIEHTWLEIRFSDPNAPTIYVDPTCDQFHKLYPEIPPFYVGTEPPEWFLPDRDNLYFKVHSMTEKTIVRRIEYGLRAHLSDIIHRQLGQSISRGYRKNSIWKEMINMTANERLHLERYLEDEREHGCGYWSVCGDRECFCSLEAPVSQGFSEEIWQQMTSDKAELDDELQREFNERYWDDLDLIRDRD